MSERKYIVIDLKSFYASVECVERGLDPLQTNLVVANEEKTEKTICLAVSPSLKAFGIPGRPRLFEAIQKVKQVNEQRRYQADNRKLTGKSCNATELQADKNLSVDYIVAPPRMALYMKYSTEIYQLYLNYVSPEDIHVYSIDEVFIDVTSYLKANKTSAYDFALRMIKDVFAKTGITATAGIGTNLYLAKVAMDIVAKHIPADKDGVRIAELDERSYREKLWDHEPITDFWRVGKGYADRLAKYNIRTMGDIALCSNETNPYFNEDILYKEFGINAELLIDHAWGWEPCTIEDIKAYKPSSKSLSIGQVLPCAYDYEKGKLIVREMAERLSLDLTAKGLITDQIVLTVGYDIDNKGFRGEKVIDRYGRAIPKQAHGSLNIGRKTASTSLIMKTAEELFDKIIDKKLNIRRVYIVANHTISEEFEFQGELVQLDFFTDTKAVEAENQRLMREKKGQKAIVKIQEKYGKNALLKGMNMEEGATTIERNGQIGGHKA